MKILGVKVVLSFSTIFIQDLDIMWESKRRRIYSMLVLVIAAFLTMALWHQQTIIKEIGSKISMSGLRGYDPLSYHSALHTLINI